MGIQEVGYSAILNEQIKNFGREAGMAEVVSARELSAEEIERLSKLLQRKVGREVKIDHSADPSLLGGPVVKLGSKMVDSSVKSRLFHLKRYA